MGRDNERLKKRGWHAEIPFEIARPAFGGLAMTEYGKKEISTPAFGRLAVKRACTSFIKNKFLIS
jgi:hypothetical protein